MVFPILSGLATLLVIISFLVPLFRNGALAALAQQPHPQFDPLRLTIGFAFYYCCFFVQIFFTCALMASANMIFCGGKPTLKHGLDLAWSRVGQIAAWALIAATVGWILRTIQERAGLLGRIAIAVLGIAWSILTYFSVPVVMFEHYSLFDSIKRSGDLVRKTWGESAGKGLTFVAFNLVAAFFWIVGTRFPDVRASCHRRALGRRVLGVVDDRGFHGGRDFPGRPLPLRLFFGKDTAL
jgi:hypothetical protein